MWPYVHDVGRLAIAVTLVVAGGSKLVSPQPLARSLGQTFGWGRPAGAAAARAVAVVEVVAGLLAASYWAATVGLALTGLVGSGVVVLVVVALHRGVTAPCGCFGEARGRPVGVRNLAAGAALLAGAIGLLALPGAARVPAELLLPLTAVLAMVAVMLRDRARLRSPFRRHFRPVPAGPVATGLEVS
jgi:hypothetical protein